MNAKDNEKRTQIISVSIIAIASVIGVAAIIIAIFIASAKKNDDKSMKAANEKDKDSVETVIDENRPNGSDGTISGADSSSPESIDPEGNGEGGFIGPQEPSDGMPNPEDVDDYDDDNDYDDGPALHEPDESDETENDADDESDGGSISVTIIGGETNHIDICPILESCFVKGTQFEVEKLMGEDRTNREGKAFTTDEYVEEFQQLIYTTVEDMKVTDDCLYRYAKDMGITDVESAIKIFDIDFSKSKNFGDEGKMVRIHTDLGEGMAVLSNDNECLEIYVYGESENFFGGVEEKTLIIEIQEFNTNIGKSTYMSVGFWW